jgi:LmbE family N-acetylglucosaminyl deacetylase
MRATVLTTLVAVLLACGCGPGAKVPVQGPPFDELLAQKPRILWVAAHPDDESMAAGVLARACLKHGASCHFLVFNRGRGGECCILDGCHPDLATVRHHEMQRAARLYGATLEHYDFFNAALPVESFPTRPELERKWMAEGDPAGLVARAIRRFKPDLMISLDPYRGTTGHPEHRAAGRFALAGAQLAAADDSDNTFVAGEPPHRIRWAVHAMNKYWIMAAVGLAHDPKPYSAELDSDEQCLVDRQGAAQSCIDVGAANTLVHRSQDGDMASIRSGAKFLGTAYVRLLDPFGSEANELVASIGVDDPNEQPMM